ncbi:MAG: EAL domain-containing protein [Nitrospirota bacterium]|nr:EAL domain-containing protein [Nitrospirota bacterium]
MADPGLWSRLVHPDDLILARATTMEIINSGAPGTRTYRIRRNGSGEEVWIEDRIVPEIGDQGAVVGWWGAARDITDHMKMLESLRLQTARLSESQRIAHLGTWEWDMTTNELWWSDEIYNIFGLRPGEFPATYDAFLERVHPDDRTLVRDGVDRAILDRLPYELAHRILLSDGTVLFVQEKANVRYDMTGRAVKMVGTVQDITTRQRMEDAVRESEQRFRAIFNSVHDGILVIDAETRRFFLANETISAMLGYDLRELANLGIEDVHPAEDLPSLFGHLDKLRAGEVTAVSELRLRRRDGSDFYADIGATPMTLNNRSYIIGVYRDITEQKKSMEELRMLSAVIEHSVNVVFITDRDGNIEYVNPTFERTTGWTKEEAIGRNPRILASGKTTRAEYEELWNIISSGRTWRGAFQNRKKDGQYYWGNSVVTPISNEKGEITHFLAVQEDITERKIAEDRLQYLAAYDELTGLLNRSRFMETLQEWIGHHAVYTGERGCLLIIDIDDFKYINETRGHAAGDEIIKQMGHHLQSMLAGMESSLRKEAGGIRLARLGGDEFAVFLPGLEAASGQEAAERLRASIERFRPVELSAPLTASIGAVVYPDNGSTVKELFTKADAALYRSKRLAKNQIRFFRAEDHDLEYAHSRLRQKESIQSAIAEDRFLPWFQPILRISDGVVSHYEALARLRDQDGKIVYPAEFIDAAEAFGLIGTIDRTIAEKTMLLQRECAKRGQHLHFGMNLSGKELGDEELLAYLQQKISETGADPGNLIFEITETAAVHDLERARKFINSLKSTGCRFSLDDFGVGFTSFLYLRELGVDYIKIDGSFIRNLPHSRNDQLFVKAIIDVARGMGIKTIAEFVENEEILNMLRGLGVDYAQGYFIGKPMSGILRV